MSGGSRKNKNSPEDFQVRIGEDELGRIFHLRDSVDQIDTLIQHLEHYRELDWVMEARGEGVENLDFSQSPETWGERLMTLALAGVKVDLGIKTGLPSRLLVLETPPGETLLDSYGEWRSACRALAGEDRELHYFMLPPASRVPISGKLEDFHVQIYGQGGLAPAPPSRCSEDEQCWTWLTPPWEIPPDTPGPSLWEFLEDFGLLKEAEELGIVGEVLPWDQVYALIAPHEGLIRTLLTPPLSMAAYYRELAQQAWKAGITEPAVLFALLWHAPQGDARRSPERLTFIQELAVSVPRDQVGAHAKPGAPAPPFPQDDPLGVSASVPEFQSSNNGLVEFMENRVILDRSRYESMIFELAELTAKAEALQRRLEEWERQNSTRKSAEGTDEEQMFQTPAPQNKEFPFDTLVGSSQAGQRHKPLSSLRAVVQEFMKNNTDLAANPDSVRMLQFCLRNYIDLNPELNALPLAEKLEMAGKMAREFLTQVCQRTA
ncbi:MAG: hypothetical protein WAU47_08555 [Desulfobaccales bacterium]